MKRPSPAADVCRRRTTTRRQNDRKQTRRLPERFQRDEQHVGTTTDRRAQSTAGQLRPPEKITGLAPIPDLPNAQQPIVRSALIPSFRPVSSATPASSSQQPKPTAVATHLATSISMKPSTLKMPKSAIAQTQLLPKAHPSGIADAAGTTDRVTEAKGYEELGKRQPAAAGRPVTVSGTYETFGKGNASAHRYSNYPMGRAKATKSTIRGKAKTATVRPDAMVLTPKTLSSLPSSAPVLPTSSQLTAPTPPKVEPWLQRLFSFKKSSRLAPHRIAVIAAVVVAVIIIVVSIGIAVGYVMTKKEPATTTFYDKPAMTFFESHCSQSKHPMRWKWCVVGSPPAIDSCTVAGRCTTFLYGLADGPLRRSELTDGTTTYQYPKVQQSRYPLLCKMRTGGDIRTGVCSKEGRCDRLYLGARHETWDSESTWEDNCDEANRCWNDTAAIRQFGQRNSLTREQCRQRDAVPQTCEVGVDAVVWMQHLRCKVGRNRTTAKPCEGLPLRLWRCGGKCPMPSYSLCTDTRLTSNCEYSCMNRSALHVLPDGAKCIYSGNQSKEAYCYDGRCFPTEVYNRQDRQIVKKIMDIAECKKRKESDDT